MTMDQQSGERDDLWDELDHLNSQQESACHKIEDLSRQNMDLMKENTLLRKRLAEPEQEENQESQSVLRKLGKRVASPPISRLTASPPTPRSISGKWTLNPTVNIPGPSFFASGPSMGPLSSSFIISLFHHRHSLHRLPTGSPLWFSHVNSFSHFRMAAVSLVISTYHQISHATPTSGCRDRAWMKATGRRAVNESRKKRDSNQQR
ncbi:hypothetical protein CCH79_00009919, partial [Gambusia affinis]